MKYPPRRLWGDLISKDDQIVIEVTSASSMSLHKKALYAANQYKKYAKPVSKAVGVRCKIDDEYRRVEEISEFVELNPEDLSGL